MINHFQLLLIFGLLSPTFSLIFAPKINAQEISCRESIESAKRGIAGFISVGSNKMNPAYQEFPRQKPYIIGFVYFDPNDSNNPSQLLTKISKNILTRCKDVGVVSFTLRRSDYVRLFGTVNGEVKQFECFDWSKNRGATPWGFQGCL